MKKKLLGLTQNELKEVALEVGLPKFAGGQIAQWLYVHKVKSIDDMTNLSKAGREKLSEKYEVGLVEPADYVKSVDGTKKYFFPVTCQHGGKEETSGIEAVIIPDRDRRTICISSQAGCKMGCAFCMTGRQGFHGNLSVADIISQFIAVEESEQLTNAVFMGMGEPLDNYENVKKAIEILTAKWGFAWSPRRITLSTIGVIPALKKFLDETECHLAVSLHNPFSEERAEFMPVQKAFPAEEVIDLIRQYDFSGQRRVSFEYTMFGGVNDSKRYADALVRMLKGLKCRVNLIRFHKIPDFPYECSATPIMEAFRDRLNRMGIIATIRASKGEDILAACGMLAGSHNANDVK